MKNFIIKAFLAFFLLNSSLFGAVEESVVLCNQLDTKYDAKVFRKVTILLTEARLELQKKYKKYLNFEYQETLIEDKEKLKEMLKNAKARYYVSLEIKDKSKGNCPNNKCDVDYIVKIYDVKTNKSLKTVVKAEINNNEFTEIKVGYIKSATKKLVKFLKAR